MRVGWGAAAIAAFTAAAALAGCERASTTARARTEDRPATAASGAGSDYASRDAGNGARSGSDGYGTGASDRAAASGGDGYARRAREPVPDFHGEPMWSDNRRYSAQENATYHCGRNGPDIGATGLDDCLTKVHAFIDHPPADVETLSRPNGDRLMYDPKANLFVVARRDGAPRTFFKPNTGAAYWAEQKQRAASGDDGYRRRGGSDEGSGA